MKSKQTEETVDNKIPATQEQVNKILKDAVVNQMNPEESDEQVAETIVQDDSLVKNDGNLINKRILAKIDDKTMDSRDYTLTDDYTDSMTL